MPLPDVMPATEEKRVHVTERYVREGGAPPVEGLEETNFTGYSSNAIDKNRGVQVYLSGREKITHVRGEHSTWQPSRLYYREEDDVQVGVVSLKERSEGFEQIAVDYRDALFAMGCEEVCLLSDLPGEEYVVYRQHGQTHSKASPS